MKKRWLGLVLILILGATLRFWQLGQVPASPDWDEASLGYNAFSLLRTGRDEHGQSWPLFLRSFGDYKPALYGYLIIPFIKLFGLNVFTVRLPAAILGTLAILLTYFLVKEIFSEISPPRSRQAPPRRWLVLPLTTAFLLAISPWHLQFSRVAFESNIGVFFSILWVWLFLKGLRQPKFLALASFFAGLNIYVYQAEKVFTPLLVLAMLFIWRRKILKIPWRYLLASLIVGLLVVLPFIYLIFASPEIFMRARDTSLAADQTPFLAKSANRLLRDYQQKNYLGLIFDNRRIAYLTGFINGYVAHFDLNWLFLTGDEIRHHAPGMGLLYLWEILFLLWGVYQLVFGKFSRRVKATVFSWFLLASVPAAFSSGSPHAVRTLRFLPMIYVFIGLGLIEFWQWLQTKKKSFKFGVLVFYFLFFIFNFVYFLNQYFVQQNYFNSQAWQYGYQPAVAEIQAITDNYQKIIVSNQPHLDQSYIFFLFYLQFDPLTYQKTGSNQGFGKYVFRPIKWETEEKNQAILYVGRPQDFPESFQPQKTVYFLDGEPAIVVGEI